MEQRLAFGQNVQTEMEVSMWKKVRQFYWYKRDRGEGKQVILSALFLVLFVCVLFGAGVKKFTEHANTQTSDILEEGVSTGASVGALTVTGSAVSREESGAELVHEQTPVPVPSETFVDTSGMESFLGFMSDAAYEKLKEEVIVECRNRGCNSVKKLNYQQTKDNSYEVISFVLLSDGSVYQCSYNLKSNVSDLALTGYTESDVIKMQQKERETEQKALEKQQKEEKKKLVKEAAKKKKAKTKTTKKKVSKKKHKKK